MMTNVMVKTWIEQKIIKNSNPIQAMKNSVCPKANVTRRPIFPQFPNCGFNKRHDNREVTFIEFYESRICPNIYRMFRSVDWTHYMIIVKWHLFIWHERKALRPDKCATGSIHANGSMTINVIPCLLFCRSGLCLALWAIHICSKLQATTILAGITIHWALRRIFSKIFCVSNDDKCYGENMNWTENYQKFESDSGNEE